MIGALLKKTLFAALLALSTGCRPSIYETYAYSKEYDPRQHEYLIGVADTVQITVYHSTDLSSTGTVRPDGVVTMPLIGDLLVAGKTPSQVRDDMQKKLAAYVKADTVVNVTVTGFNSYRFVVTGNVNRAGVLIEKYFVTVSEALAAAGGLNKFAGDQIIVFRLDANRKVREIPISYKMLMSGRHPEMDLCVVTGDTIFVP